MAPHRLVLAATASALLTGGCASIQAPAPSGLQSTATAPSASPRVNESRRYLLERKRPKVVATPAAPPAPVVLGEDLIAVGYASVTAQPSNDAAEKRLMAARASRVDAYRNMAELVYGITFGSESAIEDSKLRQDTTRTRISGRLRGVEVLSMEPLGNDSYQTTLRLPAAEVARLRKSAEP